MSPVLRQAPHRFAGDLTRVTGSNSLKVGFDFTHASIESQGNDYGVFPSYTYQFRNQLPAQVTYWATPTSLNANFSQMAICLSKTNTSCSG